MFSGVMYGFDRLLFDIYEPRLRDRFKYHPNGEYLLKQMRNGELTPDEMDSAFIAAEAYMSQEILQDISQETPVDNVVSLEEYRNAKNANT